VSYTYVILVCAIHCARYAWYISLSDTYVIYSQISIFRYMSLPKMSLHMNAGLYV